jgi:hypothetical protein
MYGERWKVGGFIYSMGIKRLPSYVVENLRTASGGWREAIPRVVFG